MKLTNITFCADIHPDIQNNVIGLVACYTHQSLFDITVPRGIIHEIEVQFESNDLTNLRPLIRDLIWLLSPSGTGRIDLQKCPNDWKYTDLECYRLENSIRKIHFTKGQIEIQRKNDLEIQNDGLSICIMSGGGNDVRLERLLRSIPQNLPIPLDVLIVGPKPQLANDLITYRHLPFAEDLVDARIDISKKKNIAVNAAKFESVILLHDRFSFATGFFEQFGKIRPDWEVLVFPQNVENISELRLTDWCEYECEEIPDHEISCLKTTSFFPLSFRNMDVANIDYLSYSDTLTISGGAFGIKKSVFLRFPMLSHLKWSEVEDGIWSQILRCNGIIFSLAANCTLETLNDGRFKLKNIRKIKIPKTLRTLLFTILFKISGRLSRSRDYMTSNGVLGRRIRRISLLNDHSAIKDMSWEDIDEVYIRDNFIEYTEIREPLSRLKAVPIGKSIWISIGALAIPFYRRSTGYRNCEMLCAEISSVLKDDLKLKSLFALASNTFLLEYKVVGQKRFQKPRRILVLNKTGNSIQFNGELLDYDQNRPVDYDAVLLNFDLPQSLDLSDEILSEYEVSGSTIFNSYRNKLLRSNILISREIVETCLGNRSFQLNQNVEAFFETNFILHGYVPNLFNLPQTT